MGEIRDLRSYLERLSQGAPVSHITPTRPVFVTKAKAMSGGDNTKPMKVHDTETIAIVPKPVYTNPWDDISVLLLGPQGPDGRYHLGRTANSSLTIPNPTVSKEHGVIYGSHDDWVFVDKGSTNGTFTSKDGGNYERVTAHRECSLRSQGWIRFGTVETQFFVPKNFVDYLRFMDGLYAQRKKLT